MQEFYKPTFMVMEEAAMRRRADAGLRHTSGMPWQRNAEDGRSRQNQVSLRQMHTAAGDIIRSQMNVVQRISADRDLEALVKRGITSMTDKLPTMQRRARFTRIVNFNRVIGVDECVPAPVISLDDKAQFLVIPRHHEPVRVVTDLKPLPCSTLALVLEAANDHYLLIAAWIGRDTPRQPHDIRFKKPFQEATRELDFWCRHALVAKPEWGRPWQSTWRQVIQEAIA